MKPFRVSIWVEDGIYVAQCLDVDVASQGDTEREALDNLAGALQLHFSEPVATILPKLTTLEVDLGAT